MPAASPVNMRALDRWVYPLQSSHSFVCSLTERQPSGQQHRARSRFFRARSCTLGRWRPPRSSSVGEEEEEEARVSRRDETHPSWLSQYRTGYSTSNGNAFLVPHTNPGQSSSAFRDLVDPARHQSKAPRNNQTKAVSQAVFLRAHFMRPKNNKCRLL